MWDDVESITFRADGCTYKANQLHPGVLTIGMGGGYSNISTDELHSWIRNGSAIIVYVTSNITEDFKALLQEEYTG